jgi:hypothetical protein
VLFYSVPKPAAVFLLLLESISQPQLFSCFVLPQHVVSPADQALVFALVVSIPASQVVRFHLRAQVSWLCGYPSRWKSSRKSSFCVVVASHAVGLIFELPN